MFARFFLLCGMCLLAGCGPSPVSPTPPPPVRPALDEPRAQIRAELLSRTPVGKSTADVLRFIDNNLREKPDAPAPRLEPGPATSASAAKSDRAGTQHIRVVLGAYLANPALLLETIPLPIEDRVTAQWAFDAQGRLLDVFVEKTAQLGDLTPPE